MGKPRNSVNFES